MDTRLLWAPSEKMIEDSNLHHFMAWLKKEKGMEFGDYESLWNWSTSDIEGFWESTWQYFNIKFEGKYEQVLQGERMPYYTWFEGARLNYAEHVFQHYTENSPAIIFKAEDQPLVNISWATLKSNVAALQRTLLQAGIAEGDCIAGFLPCITEATVAFLATNSIGAVWTSCSPDFGSQSVIDRFAQTKPKILVTTMSYGYGGKSFDKSDVIEEVIKQLPELQLVILIGTPQPQRFSSTLFTTWSNATTAMEAPLTFRRVPFQHPMWVLYSSGTTGLPKAITHSQGGILLEHLKYLTFHNNLKPGERFFWYTTTGWMMWNYIQSSLLCGATLVLYDGSPGYPDSNVLWRFAEEAGIHHFGTSAGFIISNMKSENRPGKEADLSSLRSIGSTGSTLPPEGFDWVYAHVKKDLWLASMSGGTDVCSAFVGGDPTGPVYSGEIQCRALGCRMEAFDENGASVLNEVGEMVITRPMPSMPIYFWNDQGFKRYTESYFEMYPSVWRHGDWITITPRHGIIIYGRSDATLNRGGVRIGTSEIYRAVDKVVEVRDSLIVCLEREGGEFYMPLFVQLAANSVLSDELRKKINQVIRSDYSPRHVPDQIVAVPEIPYTMSGKKTETPVKKILMGKPIAEVASSGSLRNPDSLKFFVEFYKTLGK